MRKTFTQIGTKKSVSKNNKNNDFSLVDIHICTYINNVGK